MQANNNTWLLLLLSCKLACSVASRRDSQRSTDANYNKVLVSLQLFPAPSPSRVAKNGLRNVVQRQTRALLYRNEANVRKTFLSLQLFFHIFHLNLLRTMTQVSQSK